MSDSSGDDLLNKKKEFVDSFFRRGAEFAEEILHENEKLRFRVVQLEEQLAANDRPPATPGTLKELVEKIHDLEAERHALVNRYATVERESAEWSQRLAEIERENNNLASLYVASYQLHSTLNLREVFQTILEILINFVGARVVAVMLVDEAGDVRAVASDGIPRAQIPVVRKGQGVIGRTAGGGELHVGAFRSGIDPVREDPVICVPLRFQEHTVGVLAVWGLLVQKTELAEVDFEIFDLLGAHASSAIEAARLAAAAGDSPRQPFSALAGLLED
jgi:nitrate/nitrite-specific signal transduction histidine kinase